MAMSDTFVALTPKEGLLRIRYDAPPGSEILRDRGVHQTGSLDFGGICRARRLYRQHDFRLEYHCRRSRSFVGGWTIQPVTAVQLLWLPMVRARANFRLSIAE